MLDKPIEQITVADLQELIDEKRHEGKTIDYKAELWRIDKASNPNQADRDKQTIEFLKDVSSFANTDGGHLIVGMKEEDGIASELCGITVASQDEWRNRLDQLLQKWIDPRIATSIRFLNVEEEKLVLLVHISPSSIGPHRVIHQEHGHFYARNSHGAYQMDTEELRMSFSRSLSLADRVHEFRRRRVKLIESEGLPIPLGDVPRLIMHLVPQTSVTTSTEFSIEQMKTQRENMYPLGLDYSFRARPNLDGYLSHSATDDHDDHPFRGYVQLFRNGAIEAASTRISYRRESSQDRRWRQDVEKSLLDAFPPYLQCMLSLDVRPPFWLMVSLSRVTNVRFPSEGLTRKFDRDLIFLPERLISDLDTAPLEILQPIFDQIWNAVGYDECHRLDSEGKQLQLHIDHFSS